LACVHDVVPHSRFGQRSRPSPTGCLPLHEALVLFRDMVYGCAQRGVKRHRERLLFRPLPSRPAEGEGTETSKGRNGEACCLPAVQDPILAPQDGDAVDHGVKWSV
jgi:hypothetical protein